MSAPGARDGYTVDLALLDQTTELIAQFVRSLDGTLANIDSDVVQRLLQVWGGEGSEAFGERHARWTQAITRANGEVEEMRLAARTAHSNYTSARSTNISMLGR